MGMLNLVKLNFLAYVKPGRINHWKNRIHKGNWIEQIYSKEREGVCVESISGQSASWSTRKLVL